MIKTIADPWKSNWKILAVKECKIDIIPQI
jgi:hypothetical protein